MENFFLMILNLIFICGAILAGVLAICAVIFAVYTVRTVYHIRHIACTKDFDLNRWCAKVFAYVAQLIFLAFLSGVICLVLYVSHRSI